MICFLNFCFSSSDGWNDRDDVVKDQPEAAAGGISVRLHSPDVKEFNDRWLDTTPATEHRNPWFNEFWEYKFKCYMSSEKGKSPYNKSCTGRYCASSFGWVIPIG